MANYSVLWIIDPIIIGIVFSPCMCSPCFRRLIFILQFHKHIVQGMISDVSFQILLLRSPCFRR